MTLNTRTLTLAIAALGLFAGALAAPAASADTTIPAKEPDNCPQVYLFEFEGPYTTVDASDGCVSVTIHDEEACEYAANSNTLLEHEGGCEFTLNSGPFECPQGDLCPPKPGDGAETTTEPDWPPTICLYPVGC